LEQFYYDEQFELGGKNVTVAIADHFLDETFILPLRYHSHAGYEVQLISGGSGSVLMDDGVYAVETGDLVLIRPECKHKMDLGEGQCLRRITFLFFLSGEEKTDAESRYLLAPFEQAPAFLKVPHMVDRLPEIPIIQKELAEQQPCFRLRIRTAMIGLFIAMARAFDAQLCYAGSVKNVYPTDVDKNRAQKIEDILHNYEYQNMTCSEIAKKLNLSQRQLERILQKLYHKDFRTLRLELRMDTANALLEEGSLTMEEIAEKLGYSSVPAFYAAYRKFYGMPPGKYKKSSKN